MGRLAAFPDGPDHKRLASPHVAGNKDLVGRRPVIDVVRQHIAATVEFESGFIQQSGFRRAGEADGEEHQIGPEDELAAGYGLSLLIDASAFHPGDATLLTLDAQGRGLKLAIRTLGLAGRGPHLGWPIGPDRKLVLALRRPRSNVELRDREGALAE